MFNCFLSNALSPPLILQDARKNAATAAAAAAEAGALSTASASAAPVTEAGGSVAAGSGRAGRRGRAGSLAKAEPVPTAVKAPATPKGKRARAEADGAWDESAEAFPGTQEGLSWNSRQTHVRAELCLG